MTRGEQVAEKLSRLNGARTVNPGEVPGEVDDNLFVVYKRDVAAAIDKAIADHIASVQPVRPEDAAVVEEARKLLREHDNDVSTLWSELLAHIDRQQAFIARLLNDDETGLFDAGREAGRREEREACAKLVEADGEDGVDRMATAIALGQNAVIAEAIRERGSKEGKPPAL